MSDRQAEIGEGRRERKRRQTRERIVESALELFLARGFDGATVDDIAAAADISKRSFFDYFPTKEDVVSAWQDAFGEALATSVAAQPANWPLARVVESALVATIGEAAYPRAFAIDELIRATPALRAREHLKYARLEETLAAALLAREAGAADPFGTRLLAMLVAGAMRISANTWRSAGEPGAIEDHAREVFATVWERLSRFAVEARA